MGTTYSVKLVGRKSDLPSEEVLVSWADDTFAAINQSMSTYISDSELSLINKSEVSGAQKVSDDLFYVLALSQQVSGMTSGAFDITVAPLVNIWGFGPQAQQEHIPSPEEIDTIKSSIGFEKLELKASDNSVIKPVGLSMDLSAIAKGFAADRFAQVLFAKGYTNAMVEVGGELMLMGLSQRGTPWSIGIETPMYDLITARAPARLVSLSNKGMATSGDYRNYYEEDGVRYSHTIDPLTGRPISHNLASVTVIADKCAEADALATALNVMGPERAIALAEREGLAVYLIVRNQKGGFEAQHSSAFKAYLLDE